MDSYFEKGIVLKGTLWIKGQVHFGASITGDIHSSDHLIISNTGSVKGTIYSYNISNSGKPMASQARNRSPRTSSLAGNNPPLVFAGSEISLY